MQIKTKDKIVQEAAKRCLTDEIEEAMINRMNIIGQNGNDGLHYIDVNDEEEI